MSATDSRPASAAEIREGVEPGPQDGQEQPTNPQDGAEEAGGEEAAETDEQALKEAPDEPACVQVPRGHERPATPDQIMERPGSQESERACVSKGSPASRKLAMKQSSFNVPTVPGPYLVSGVRGGRFGTGKSKTDVEWKVYRAAQVPGPGQYTFDESKRLSGGRFSTAKPKTDVDWEVLRASKIPAPGQYRVKDYQPSGGRFSTAVPMSDLDWKIKRSLEVPGPGEYKVDRHYSRSGGRMSTSTLITDVDIAARRASKIPGPGEYNVDSAHKFNGGRFSSAKPKTELEWIEYRARQIPGPGQYKRLDATPSGGKFNASTPKSDLEIIMMRSARLPGPGAYDSDPYSVAKRTGAVPPYAGFGTTSCPATPQRSGLQQESSVPRSNTPKLKAMKKNRSELAEGGGRPHTSLGFVEGQRERMNETPDLVKKKMSALPWHKRGVSREGTREHKAKWLLPESAQRAYGIWVDEYSRAKKPKRRQRKAKAVGNAQLGGISSTLETEAYGRVRADSSNEYEVLEVYTPKPQGNTGGRLLDNEQSSVSRKGVDELSDSAKKLFDLAMESDQFRQMMQLYTGMEDPTSVIKKYAEMW